MGQLSDLGRSDCADLASTFRLSVVGGDPAVRWRLRVGRIDLACAISSAFGNRTTEQKSALGRIPGSVFESAMACVSMRNYVGGAMTPPLNIGAHRSL